jgi:hypothetical protein
MRALEQVAVDDETRAAVTHGSVFAASALVVDGAGPFALVDRAGDLVAVYERKGAALKPAVVLAANGSAS